MDHLQVIELVASALVLLNVYLLTRQNMLAWPVGVIAVALFAYFLYQNDLYAVTLLHLIYILVNLYGWWNWSKNNDQTDELPVSTLNLPKIAIWTSLIGIGTFAWVYLIAPEANNLAGYADAFILMGSLAAQFMVAHKILENWVLWIIVNIVGICLYYYNGLYITTGLYFILVFLCAKGFFDWKKDMVKANA